jgi:hypothetical protein
VVDVDVDVDVEEVDVLVDVLVELVVEVELVVDVELLDDVVAGNVVELPAVVVELDVVVGSTKSETEPAVPLSHDVVAEPTQPISRTSRTGRGGMRMPS